MVSPFFVARAHLCVSVRSISSSDSAAAAAVVSGRSSESRRGRREACILVAGGDWLFGFLFCRCWGSVADYRFLWKDTVAVALK